MYLELFVVMFVLGNIIRKHFLTDIELANFSLRSAADHIFPRNIRKEHVLELVHWYIAALVQNARYATDAKYAVALMLGRNAQW